MQISDQRPSNSGAAFPRAIATREPICTFFVSRVVRSANTRIAEGLPRRLIEIVRWIGPTVTLIVLPKCPMCLVGYIAVITGAGVSMAFAEALHTAVIGGAVALLAWPFFRAIRGGSCKAPIARRIGLRSYSISKNP